MPPRPVLKFCDFLQHRMSGAAAVAEAAAATRKCGNIIINCRSIGIGPYAPVTTDFPSCTKHTRAIRAEAFAREDDLWDAHLTDIKTRDTKLALGLRPANQVTNRTSIQLVFFYKSLKGSSHENP